jgi:hypothetical protein
MTAMVASERGVDRLAKQHQLRGHAPALRIIDDGDVTAPWLQQIIPGHGHPAVRDPWISASVP